MGMYCEVSAVTANEAHRGGGSGGLGHVPGSSTATADAVSLEKAWHGLHYLLTGEVWEGNGPLAFLLAGGQHLGGDEEAPRWFTPDETLQIDQALSGVSDDALWSRFDADEMEQQEIYPGIWDEDEEDLKEEYIGYFQALKRCVAAAAQSGRGLLIDIG